MTRSEALKYTIEVARELGYSYAEVFAFTNEIDDRLSLMIDTSKEALDEMISELF